MTVESQEGLPPHLTPEEVASVIQHNWLYSVVPVSVPTPKGYIETGALQYDYPIVPYLVGYCRGCGKSFSKEVPISGSGAYLESPMDVEKYGCLGV